MLKNLADSSDGCDKWDSWTLNTALHDKVGLSRKGDFQQILLSMTVEDAWEFGKYFRYVLQGGREGSGMAQSNRRF